MDKELKIVSPYGRPDDRFGYAVYSCVAFAAPEQQQEVQALRDAVKAQRSMMPAHVTVKGTFCEIPSLDAVKALIAQIAEVTPGFFVEFEGGIRLGRTYDTAPGWAGVQFRKTPELVGLHDSLYRVLAPVTTNAYGLERGDDYRPHMTVFDEPLPELKQLGKELAAKTKLRSPGFPVSEIWFMGHVGPPYRGRWMTIESFRLKS